MANSYSGGFSRRSIGSPRGGSNGALLGVLGLVAAGAAAMSLLRVKGDIVTAKSGKSWRVVLLSNRDGVKTYELFAPEGSFGPHGELSVLRYSQTGSDTGTRKLVGIGSGVPPVMVTTAGADFAVPLPPALQA